MKYKKYGLPSLETTGRKISKKEIREAIEAGCDRELERMNDLNKEISDEDYNEVTNKYIDEAIDGTAIIDREMAIRLFKLSNDPNVKISKKDIKNRMSGWEPEKGLFGIKMPLKQVIKSDLKRPEQCHVPLSKSVKNMPVDDQVATVTKKHAKKCAEESRMLDEKNDDRTI